jgi:hypothetical protein
MRTAADDAQALLDLADHLDPKVQTDKAPDVTPDDLRAIAALLERIGSGDPEAAASQPPPVGP